MYRIFKWIVFMAIFNGSSYLLVSSVNRVAVTLHQSGLMSVIKNPPSQFARSVPVASLESSNIAESLLGERLSSQEALLHAASPALWRDTFRPVFEFLGTGLAPTP